MNHKNMNELISESMAIEAQEAKAAGALGYMCRSLVQATLPHKRVEGTSFVRKNGTFTLAISSPILGLPFGSIPRLLVAWLSTEAVKTKERKLILGHSLGDFVRQVGYEVQGGQRGDLTRIKNQTERLFASTIQCYCAEKIDNPSLIGKLDIVKEATVWWTPRKPEQRSLWESTVLLSEEFFKEVTENPVPIDLRALKALKRSPMALDIYTWLTYRNSYLRRSTVVPWASLQMQFGAEYKLTKHFREAFLEQMKKVSVVYPEAKVSEHEHGLMLMPSPTHISMISARFNDHKPVDNKVIHAETPTKDKVIHAETPTDHAETPTDHAETPTGDAREATLSLD